MKNVPRRLMAAYRLRHPARTRLLRLLWLPILPVLAQGEAAAQGPDLMTNRLIVKLRADVAVANAPSPIPPNEPAMNPERARALSVSAAYTLTPFRTMSNGAHVLALGRWMPSGQAGQIAARLARDPSVLYAEPDSRRLPQETLPPHDPYYAQQWYLLSSPPGGAQAGGINALPAWQAGYFGQNVVVAVLDTGILPHPDITGQFPARTVLGTTLGYDFVSADADGSFTTANDGNGRDPDPTDPGNWVTAQESADPSSPLYGCPVANSDWHGTHTAGLIAATADNGIGIAGVAHQAAIVPLRVLGKCGGFVSDIADAIRWAGGLTLADPPPGGAIPAAQAAQVINLSLGGTGPCSQTEQEAISDALAAGGVRAIVAAAGNGNGGNANNFAPGNCSGVISVAAVDINGALARYSNIGPTVTLSAPGGYFPDNPSPAQAASGILSLFNNGLTSPVLPYDPGAFGAGDYAYFYGTSESAALVSGVAALMLSANPSLSANQLSALLTGSANGFPDCTCSSTTCGAGIVNADGAVRSALASTVAAGTPGASGCPAPAQTSGGGSSGHGGCTVADPGAGMDPVLPLAVLVALVALASSGPRRRRAR